MQNIKSYYENIFECGQDHLKSAGWVIFETILNIFISWIIIKWPLKLKNGSLNFGNKEYRKYHVSELQLIGVENVSEIFEVPQIQCWRKK